MKGQKDHMMVAQGAIVANAERSEARCRLECRHEVKGSGELTVNARKRTPNTCKEIRQ